ncbi:concanavalin A-like lectin/glucanase domain-containing protein [Chlamydoabsidia padenii]|nr:concanavalin A-like lectin/glucanase domain-containing protein [Chlamydoabsidia padenii]
METNTFISGRTELQFFHGECSLQTNLPLPRNQDVYYWEAKMYEKPQTTVVSIGVATKPYPNWRLPGWNRHSVGYFSDTGNKHLNNPFHGKAYALGYQEGDVIGVGYRHRSGTIFFTKNGRKLEDACTSLRWNLFPTIGANGPCQIHVNLGQMGFVFVEANVKKWGLAPMHGTLAAPPAYGFEAGSLLLERGSSGQQQRQNHTIESDNDDNNQQQPLIRSTLQPTSIPSPRRTLLPTQSPPSYSTLPRPHFMSGYGSNGVTTTLITTPTHDST